MNSEMNWTDLGAALRQSAMDAHDELPKVKLAYSFLLDNPEFFLSEGEEWPAGMPIYPPSELIAAYQTAT